jgi:hypothetical protein
MVKGGEGILHPILKSGGKPENWVIGKKRGEMGEFSDL